MTVTNTNCVKKSQSGIAEGEGGGRKLCSTHSKSTPFTGYEMSCIDAHGIPRHLSQAASPSVPGESDAHSGFPGKGEPKEISGLQPLALSSSYFPHLLFPSLFSLFYFFSTVSFIPAGKDQNITVRYAQKKPPLWRKKKNNLIQK